MNTCLLITDVQKGFINKFTEHIPKFVEKLQFEYETVLATRFFNKDGSFYHDLIKWHRFSKDSKDTELAFKIRSDAIVIEKHIYTCINVNFIKLLRSRNISEVHICGIDTDICVTKCAVDLFENNIVPVVLSKYCASTAGLDAHKNALKTLARYIGKSQICSKKHCNVSTGVLKIKTPIPSFSIQKQQAS